MAGKPYAYTDTGCVHIEEACLFCRTPLNGKRESRACQTEIH